MKTLLLLIVVSLFSATPLIAQQTSNETFVGYSFLRQDVRFERPTVAFNENTDSHGVLVNYTRYISDDGTFGITGEVGANFTSENASLVTVMAGATLKARNAKYVQPFVRALGGAARQKVDRQNITNFAQTNGAFLLGGGFDFGNRDKSKVKFRVGADYLNVGFNGERNHGLRLSTGIVF